MTSQRAWTTPGSPPASVNAMLIQKWVETPTCKNAASGGNTREKRSRKMIMRGDVAPVLRCLGYLVGQCCRVFERESGSATRRAQPAPALGVGRRMHSDLKPVTHHTADTIGQQLELGRLYNEGRRTKLIGLTDISRSP
jgi:hypothetical protein